METNLTQEHVTRVPRRGLPFLFATLLCMLCGFSVSAQNILTEGFEGSTYPPTGWSRAITSGSYNWDQSGATTASYPSSIAPHGGTKYVWYNTWYASSGSTAELRTPALNFTGTSLVQVSFWFYRHNTSSSYTDNIDVIVNTAATASGGTILGRIYANNGQSPAVPVANMWYKYSFTIPSSFNGTTNYIIFKGNSAWGPDMFLDDISVDNVQPCSGPASAGSITPSGSQTVCPGTRIGFAATGYTLAGATTQHWQYQQGTGNWTDAAGPGSNTDNWTSFPILTTTKFRWYQWCSNTGDSTFSNITTVNVTGGGTFPVYAGLPFNESFESWTNGCSTTDLPSLSWTNSPATGNSSFRRNDQGSSASWSNATSGMYTPAAAVGTYSARLHTYSVAAAAGKGSLSCYVDCSGSTGAKQLEFYLNLNPTATYQDSCYVEFSTDGGMSWSLLQRYGPGTGKWDFKTVSLNSNSATTIIRWTMWQNYQYTGYNDVGLDGVRILPPCGAKPVAGKIDSVEACKGKNFQLSLTGTSANAGLTYEWQFKPTGSTLPWAPLAGGNVGRPTANISVPTSFRVIVGCGNLTPSPADTSAVFDVKLMPFYYCYCNAPTSIQYPGSNYSSIAEVKVENMPSLVVLMSNPTGNTPTYTSYQRSVPAPILIRDSTYRFSMLSVSGLNGYIGGSNAAFFLDYNRNGIWDLPQERIMNKTSGSSSGNWVFQNYTIPTNANVGLTGLRAMHAYYITQPTDPCGALYYNGEIEDYLVYIEYQPCSGPVNAGTTSTTDTILCPGYTLDLMNTTYEQQRTGIQRMWEVSTDGGFNYNVIPNSANKDTMFNVVATASTYGLKYRLRVICSNTGDTTFSNAVTVTNPPASSCYPFASAIPPGTADSSDIGSFEIGPYTNPAPMKVSGPHLGNPSANRRRTDYTTFGPMTLAADSTYRLAVFHTMRTMNHADALVSVFIDFNHDGLYSVTSPGYPYPAELIYQGKTTSSDFYLDTVFKMPSTLIGGVPTGLRVVLNNDVNPSGSGNNGTGGFVSGEVEDYVVTLSRNSLGIPGTGLIQNLALYPNPTEGKSTIVFDAPKTIGHLEMVVTTITGQQVMSRSYDHVGARFTAELDMSKVAKGAYFVELRADGEKMTQKLIVR
jgi:hypothetical protein